MKLEALPIEGAWTMTPRIHGDDRGAFLEWYRSDQFAEATGHPLALVQANCSVSSRGTVRGIHYADVPPGQAKYVTCVSGAVLDVVVDIRVGSPTFGQWCAVRLDAQERRAVYLSEGLGHGFAALTDGATVVYLCSEGYAPDREHEVHPLDPELGIDWLVGDHQLSGKDAAASSLSEARDRGLLPTYEQCTAYRRTLSAARPGP